MPDDPRVGGLAHNPARITMLVAGSDGDVRPQIALGLGLKAQGHEVTIATHELFAAQIRKLGLKFESLEVNPRKILETEAGLAWLSSQANPIKAARSLVALLRPIMRDVLDDSWRACRGADNIVCSSLAIWGHDIAESLGVPCVFTPVYPMRRTRSIPAIGAAPLPLGPMYNLLTHLFAEQISWQPFRQIVNEWRSEDLGLPPLPRSGGTRMVGWPDVLVAYGFSPSVLPRPVDWAANQQVTGYWFMDEDWQDWEPPEDAVAFINGGEPPVYVGFGSMTDPEPERLASMVVEALHLAGCRGVVRTGWSELPASHTDDVLFVDSMPHSWLFPQMAAAVHHGGAGTTAAALRAGVPSVPVPYFFDQTLWGHLVAKHGAGTRPIPRQKLTAERLAAAIRMAVHEQSLRDNAAALGTRIRAEDGIGQAVSLIAGHFGA